MIRHKVYVKLCNPPYVFYKESRFGSIKLTIKIGTRKKYIEYAWMRYNRDEDFIVSIKRRKSTFPTRHYYHFNERKGQFVKW